MIYPLRADPITQPTAIPTDQAVGRSCRSAGGRGTSVNFGAYGFFIQQSFPRKTPAMIGPLRT